MRADTEMIVGKYYFNLFCFKRFQSINLECLFFFSSNSYLIWLINNEYNCYLPSGSLENTTLALLYYR